MNLVVFTAIVGRTDALKAPTVVNPHVRYVCLSDRPQRVTPYECAIVPTAGQDIRLLSRRLKILADHPALGHPDVVLWHDAAFRMDCDPIALAVEAFTDEINMLAFQHPRRTQIEDEAAAIAHWGYAPLAHLQRQAATYRGEGFSQTMITSTGFCLRRLIPRIVAFNRFWWREVERWTWRDQMSVDYAIWKSSVRLRYIPGHYRDNPYAKWHTW